MGLEFNVELTYPVDQISGMSIIMVSAQIHAAVFILVSGALETPLPPEAKEKEVQYDYRKKLDISKHITCYGRKNPEYCLIDFVTYNSFLILS